MENSSVAAGERKPDGSAEIACTRDVSGEKRRQSKMLIKLTETINFEISKPLLFLRVAVFIWYGAGATVYPFVVLFLKQKGLELKDISFIYMVLPVVQFLAATISGMITDKIGRSKPVLQANILLAIISTTGMLFMPQANYCNKDLIQCSSRVINETMMTSYCSIKANGSEAYSCNFQCSIDPKQLKSKLPGFCFQDYISTCDGLSEKGISHDFPWPTDNSDAKRYASCVESNNTSPINFSWCQTHLVKECNMSCERRMNSTEAPCEDTAERTRIFIISFVLLSSFHIFLSNCFRTVDVTAMMMIKTHNSDFGRIRFFSIFGTLVFSLVSGYVITLVTPDGAPPKYEITFYVFGAMAVVTMTVVWKLDVKTEPPSKDLLKKIVGLLKNPDIVVFFMAIFVIGTAWGFTKLFSNWYLEELGAPSSLIGLIPAVNSIIGLPFLLTSKWFVQKIGSINLLISAMLGYAAWCIGYSFLKNPWWSLLCEVGGILNYHLLWVTVVTHSHCVAPIGSAATVISAAGGIHFGVGKGSGGLIGRYVMSQYGGKLAYRLMATVCIASAALYALYSFIRKKFTKKESDLKQLESADYELEEKFTSQI